MTEATLRTFFFTRPEEAGAALGTSAAAGDGIGDALGRVPKAARDAVFTQIGDRAAGVLDLGLQEIFRGIWDKHTALRRAGEATLADPDTEALVEMTTSDVTFDDRPGIEVRIGDLPPVTIAMEVSLDISLRGLIAVVRSGRLVAVRAGSADVTGTLSIAGQQVARNQATLDLRASIRLGAGIPLTGGADLPAGGGSAWRHRET
jgi:hypothetical protein